MNRFVLAAVAASLFLPVDLRSQENPGVTTESRVLVDHERHREVPVVIYASRRPLAGRLRTAILSHGYGMKNTDYSFLAVHLADLGYTVISIQHEIPGDAPLPTTGNPYETRMPSWKRGVQNILFVIGELNRSWPKLAAEQLLLVGHSHGGDTSMLFAKGHRELVSAVISLDNRRMPFPHVKQPRIFSLRSSDQPTDEGVVPSPEEQAKLGMRIVRLPDTKHGDMCDAATQGQKAEMLRNVDEFLRELR